MFTDHRNGQIDFSEFLNMFSDELLDLQVGYLSFAGALHSRLAEPCVILTAQVMCWSKLLLVLPTGADCLLLAQAMQEYVRMQPKPADGQDSPGKVIEVRISSLPALLS